MIVLIIVLSVLLTAVLIGLIVPYYIVFYSPHRNADEIETEPFLDDMDMFNEIGFRDGIITSRTTRRCVSAFTATAAHRFFISV